MDLLYLLMLSDGFDF